MTETENSGSDQTGNAVKDTPQGTKCQNCPAIVDHDDPHARCTCVGMPPRPPAHIAPIWNDQGSCGVPKRLLTGSAVLGWNSSSRATEEQGLDLRTI